MQFLFFTMFFCSGRLIRTFADVKYGNHKLTPVEIIYNVISFLLAIITILAFTLYAKRTLNQLKSAETKDSEEESSSDSSGHGNLELEKLPLERPKHLTT